MTSPKIVLSCSIWRTIGEISRVYLNNIINSTFPTRWEHIEFPTIQGLIVLYGFSIVASSLATCWTVQMTDNGIINIEKIRNPAAQRLLRLLLLVLTPIVPLCIIFKSVWLTLDMKMMVAEWRENSCTASAAGAWMKIDSLDKKKKNVRGSTFKMKTVETNLEGLTQLFVLICLYFIPILFPLKSGLGFDFDPLNRSPETWFLLIFSPIFSAVLSINASVGAMDAHKRGQLTSKSKAVVGLYIFFQIASKLFRLVTTVMLSLGDEPALSLRNAALLIIVPVLVHWLLIYLFMTTRIQTLPDLIEHLVSNLWIVSPARLTEERNEVHKGREQTGYLLLSGIVSTTTIVITALLMVDSPAVLLSQSPLSSASEEFLALGGGPAILCHLISCVLLAIYYR